MPKMTTNISILHGMVASIWRYQFRAPPRPGLITGDGIWLTLWRMIPDGTSNLISVSFLVVGIPLMAIINLINHMFSVQILLNSLYVIEIKKARSYFFSMVCFKIELSAQWSLCTRVALIGLIYFSFIGKTTPIQSIFKV
jgi:hypothetical protein